MTPVYKLQLTFHDNTDNIDSVCVCVCVCVCACVQSISVDRLWAAGVDWEDALSLHPRVRHPSHAPRASDAYVHSSHVYQRRLPHAYQLRPVHSHVSFWNAVLWWFYPMRTSEFTHTPCSEKMPLTCLLLPLPDANRFSNSFTGRLSSKFLAKL